MKTKKIALFASGSGTNAEKIMQYFDAHEQVEVAMLLSNKAKAGALARAEKFEVATKVFNRSTFYETEEIISLLQDREIDLIVLAGFLWLIPAPLVNAFPNKIINIHPALLPNYGGKGMYGAHVHEAIIQNKEKESGITIHYVNEQYDEGEFIFQASCEISPSDSPTDLAKKVQQLEHEHFPKVIENVLLTQ